MAEISKPVMEQKECQTGEPEVVEGVNMNRRYTMKIYPRGNGREVYRVIEISGSESLDRLCEVILSAYDFIDEHLYEFCMDCKMFSLECYQSYPVEEEASTRIKIEELGLLEKQKFALHYDFGDNWMFIINVQKTTPEAQYKEPMVTKAKGTIEQYPVYEDEDDWEDE